MSWFESILSTFEFRVQRCALYLALAAGVYLLAELAANPTRPTPLVAVLTASGCGLCLGYLVFSILWMDRQEERQTLRHTQAALTFFKDQNETLHTRVRSLQQINTQLTAVARRLDAENAALLEQLPQPADTNPAPECPPCSPTLSPPCPT